MRRSIVGAGIEVFPIGLGAMPLSIQGRPEAAQAATVIRRFVELGGDLIDTANVYCLDDRDIGHSERLIAAALEDLGADHVVVATKGGLVRPRGQWLTDARPAELRRACEQSLKDLRVERIRLYQLHAVDDHVSIEESLGELIRLKEEGKIEHIGLSNVSLPQLERALHLAPIVSVQNRFNVFEKRDIANGIIEFCANHDIAYLPHSPAGGHHGHIRTQRDRTLATIARAHAVSPYQVVLAWLLQLGAHVIPIPGASRLASIEDSMKAVGLTLTAAEIASLEAL
ncbi:MAG: aldo/keto reductase [Gammaproteobacteria bacterium]|nr:aldo/keto reductase [Gammaproteobacteria bacterium]MBI5616170.1 aldo/keto reductase [Gammaproteobacteria bacterium]